MEARESIAGFLRTSTCYDVLPKSGKVVVFDERIPLRVAFNAMIEQDAEVRYSFYKALAPRGDVQAVPLWDSKRQQPCGIITVTDIIQIITYGNKTNSINEILDEHSISSWKLLVNKLKRFPDKKNELSSLKLPGVEAAFLQAQEELRSYSFDLESDEMLQSIVFNDSNTFFDYDGQNEAYHTNPLDPVVTLGPDTNLFSACYLLQRTKSRSISIFDKAENLCLGVVSHLVILRYLVVYFREGRRLFEDSIEKLGIGTYKSQGKQILSITINTLLSDVLEIFVEKRISVLPIVDEEDRPIAVYSTCDITTITCRGSIDTCMSFPIGQFIKLPSHMDSEEVLEENGTEEINIIESASQLVLCKGSDTLQDIFVKFSVTQVHRLICIDDEGRLKGIITLSDLLSYFLGQEQT